MHTLCCHMFLQGAIKSGVSSAKAPIPFTPHPDTSSIYTQGPPSTATKTTVYARDVISCTWLVYLARFVPNGADKVRADVGRQAFCHLFRCRPGSLWEQRARGRDSLFSSMLEGTPSALNPPAAPSSSSHTREQCRGFSAAATSPFSAETIG